MRFIVSATLALFACGCLAGTGQQVKTALTQHQKVGWTNDEFTQEATGTQTNNMLMAEGEIVLLYDEDGKPTIDHEKSKITALLITSPSAGDASSSLSLAFQASTAQAQLFGDTVESLTAMLVPLLAARASPPPDDGTPDKTRADMIRDIIAAIREFDARSDEDGG